MDELKGFKRGGRVEQSKFKLQNQHFSLKIIPGFQEAWVDPVNSVIRHMLCRHPYVQTFLGTFIGGGVCGGGVFSGCRLGWGLLFYVLHLKNFKDS